MDDEIRKIDDWVVKQSLRIGDKEIVYAEDLENTEVPYAVFNCVSNELFRSYDAGFGSTDYLEVMEEFLSRCHSQIQKIKDEKNKLPFPVEIFGKDDCYPHSWEDSLLDKVVVLKPSAIRADARRSDIQLVLVTGGFGASAGAGDKKIFTTNLYTGKNTNWRRSDVIGVIRPEKMPEWAKDRLQAVLEEQSDKTSTNHKKEESR